MKRPPFLALLFALAVSPVVTSQTIWSFVARSTPDIEGQQLTVAIRENTQHETDFWKARYPETLIAFSRTTQSGGETTYSLSEYDCKNRRIRLVTVSKQNDINIEKHGWYNPYAAEWEEPSPDSIAEAKFKFVCRGPEKRDR